MLAHRPFFVARAKRGLRKSYLWPIRLRGWSGGRAERVRWQVYGGIEVGRPSGGSAPRAGGGWAPGLRVSDLCELRSSDGSSDGSSAGLSLGSLAGVSRWGLSLGSLAGVSHWRSLTGGLSLEVSRWLLSGDSGAGRLGGLGGFVLGWFWLGTDLRGFASMFEGFGPRFPHGTTSIPRRTRLARTSCLR
ncbi:MAG: hypothetical protein ACI80K_000409 [Paracoccaceae bacterium]|jgi:hypothetical protein